MSAQQPEALWMAPLLDAAELRRLHQADLDNQEWLNKTEWVQVAIQPRELGQHRADIIKQRLDFVAGQRDELMKALHLALEYWAHREQRYKNRSPVWVQEARAAIAAAT